jgi:hypothetical protein
VIPGVPEIVEMQACGADRPNRRDEFAQRGFLAGRARRLR